MKYCHCSMDNKHAPFLVIDAIAIGVEPRVSGSCDNDSCYQHDLAQARVGMGLKVPCYDTVPLHKHSAAIHALKIIPSNNLERYTLFPCWFRASKRSNFADQLIHQVMILYRPLEVAMFSLVCLDTVGVLLLLPFFIISLFLEAFADLGIPECRIFGIFRNINYFFLRRCRPVCAILYGSPVVVAAFARAAVSSTSFAVSSPLR